MKKVVKTIGIIFLLFMVIMPFIPYVMNEICLSMFSRQISHTLPDQTQIIELESVCGKLNGSGNSMDFCVAALVSSSLSLQELTDYYSDIRYNSAKSSKYEHQPDIEIQLAERDFQSDFLIHRQIDFSKIDELTTLEGYYIILIYDGGYTSGFDLRGY